MADSILYFHPSETRAVEVDFQDVLPTNDSALKAIGAGDSAIDAFDSTGLDVGSTILSAKTQTGKKLSVTISAVVDRQDYIIRFIGEGATSSQRFVKTIGLRVRTNISGAF